MNRIIGAFAVMAMIVFSGCVRVTDGEAGIRITQTGEIPDQVLDQGLYQVALGDVVVVSSRNIVLDIASQPMVMEKIPMSVFNIKVNYGVNHSKVPFIYRTQSGQHITSDDGSVYLLAKYIKYLANSAVNDVLSNYRALEVNSNRDKIEKEIKDVIIKKLISQKKSDLVNINEINILDVRPPNSVIESSIKIVNSSNALQTKINEVEIAKQESIRMAEEAKQTDDKYIELLNAKSRKTAADAMLIAATKGSLNTWVVPDGFTSLGSVSK